MHCNESGHSAAREGRLPPPRPSDARRSPTQGSYRALRFARHPAGPTGCPGASTIGTMASLTASQIEIMRRLGAGESLYSCSDIPRFLEEIILLSRLRLVFIAKSGAPSLTDDGLAYLQEAEEITQPTPLGAEPRQELPPGLTNVEKTDGAVPLSPGFPSASATTGGPLKRSLSLSEPES